MKKPKNRRKLLRTKCLKCHQVEDSLQVNCSNCGNAFFTEDSMDLLNDLQSDVSELEILLASLEDPDVKHQNPYTPVDNSFRLIRKLRSNQQIPGMSDYLVAAREVLLPYKVGVLRKTLRANSLVLVMLCLFPIVPLFLGWALMVPLLLALPPLVWAYLLWRTRNDLLKAEQDLSDSQT
jgi:RNA polymerase subunit RPABC4/transcription elongation factor Spt4